MKKALTNITSNTQTQKNVFLFIRFQLSSYFARYVQHVSLGTLTDIVSRTS